MKNSIPKPLRDFTCNPSDNSRISNSMQYFKRRRAAAAKYSRDAVVRLGLKSRVKDAASLPEMGFLCLSLVVMFIAFAEVIS